MKFSPSIYARAFAAALDEHPEKIDAYSDRLRAILKKNSDAHLAKRIFAEAARFFLKLRGARYVFVESVRTLDQDMVHAIKKEFGAKDFIETKVNPELVAGVRITIDGEETIDATMQKKLKKLFLYA